MWADEDSSGRTQNHQEFQPTCQRHWAKAIPQGLPGAGHRLIYPPITSVKIWRSVCHNTLPQVETT